MIIDGWVNLPHPVVEQGSVTPELQAVAGFFGPGDQIWTEHTPTSLLAQLDAGGVDGGLLCANLPGRKDGMDLPLCTLDEGMAALDESEGRLRLMINVPGLHDLLPTIRRLREVARDPRVLGACVGGAPLETDLTDKRLYAIYGALAEEGLALICNVGIFGPPRASKHQHPLLLEEICADFPELTVVAAHMGHPWEKLLIRLMMKFPNLYLMTSAYLPKYIEPEVLSFMRTRRGIDRVMFGSDFPMLEPARCIAEARNLDLPPEVLAGYLGDNLAKALAW